jgi:putative tryptophan/tyrosine transport system substrate-binding protein
MFNMRRRDFISLVGGSAVAWPLAGRAQQPALPVIGFLNAGTAAAYAPYVTAFRKGLSAAGHIEGRDAIIEYRWAEGQTEREPTLVAEVARQQVAVIVVTASTALALAAKAATLSIPIVFAIGADPVKFGLVASFNRPGGNVTGVSFLANFLAAKQLEVLHETVPKAAVIGLLVNPDNPNAETDTAEVRAAADALGLTLVVANARDDNDIDTALTSMVQRQASALLIGADALFRRNRIAALTVRHALPAITNARDFALAGGLMSYGADLREAYYQVGLYAGRILKGEKPADLPVVQSTKFELVINMRAAKTLGIEVPPMLQARADEVIE